MNLYVPTQAGWRRKGIAVAGLVALTLVALTLVALTFLRPQAEQLKPSPADDPEWSSGRVGTFLYHFSDRSLDVATEARRRRVIALNAGDHRYIAQIKAVNPNVKILVYKDLSSSRDWDCSNGVDHTFITSGVGYCSSDEQHPEWFLTDSAGNRLTYEGYRGHWQMDIGNAGYQEAWLYNVRGELQRRGWDGVIMDNALTRSDEYHPGVFPSRYASNASFQDAYQSMLRKVGVGLRSAGFYTVANISPTGDFPGVRDAYTEPLDAGAEQHFANLNRASGTGYGSDGGQVRWLAQLDQVTSSAARGKASQLKTTVKTGSGDDHEAFTFGLASFLLASDGRSLFGTDSTAWAQEFDWDLGRPVNSYRAVDNGVYRRDFIAGVAIVNASDSAPATIALDRLYLDRDGHKVTSVTLKPTRGAVLRLAPGKLTRTPAPAP